MGTRYWLLLLWHTVSYYTRTRRPIALIRAVSRVVFLHDNGELCQHCGRSYVLWHAEGDLYGEVHGNGGGLCCPSCFDRAAEAQGMALIWLPRDFLDWHAQRVPSPPREDQLEWLNNRGTSSTLDPALSGSPQEGQTEKGAD